MFAYAYTAEELRERAAAERRRKTRCASSNDSFVEFVGCVLCGVLVFAWFLATAAALEWTFGVAVAPGLVLLTAALGAALVFAAATTARNAAAAALRWIPRTALGSCAARLNAQSPP